MLLGGSSSGVVELNRRSVLPRGGSRLTGTRAIYRLKPTAVAQRGEPTRTTSNRMPQNYACSCDRAGSRLHKEIFGSEKVAAQASHDVRRDGPAGYELAEGRERPSFQLSFLAKRLRGQRNTCQRRLK